MNECDGHILEGNDEKIKSYCLARCYWLLFLNLDYSFTGLLMTDGYSNRDQHLTTYEADLAKSQNIEIYGIGR